jgi:hypothetical protein
MAANERSRESRSDVERTRAAWRDALPGLAVLALAAVAMFVFDVPGPNAGTGVWAVLMLAATGLFMWAEVRSLQRADEYQRLQISFLGGLVAWLGVRALQARKA